MSDLTETLADAGTKMSKAIEVAKEEFGAIRTGRAHPAMFSKIVVEYYGTYTHELPSSLPLIRAQWPPSKRQSEIQT